MNQIKQAADNILSMKREMFGLEPQPLSNKSNYVFYKYGVPFGQITTWGSDNKQGKTMFNSDGTLRAKGVL